MAVYGNVENLDAIVLAQVEASARHIDGFSPTVVTTATTTGEHIKITDKTTTHEFDILNGTALSVSVDGTTLELNSDTTTYQPQTITDSSSHFTATTVEGALDELYTRDDTIIADFKDAPDLDADITFLGGKQIADNGIEFKNNATGQSPTYPHDIKLKGGDPAAAMAVELYDERNSRKVLDYNDSSNIIDIGDSSAEVQFGGTKPIDYSSNVNGKRIQLYDGTLIQWGSGSQEVSAQTTEQVQVTYNSAFVAAPYTLISLVTGYPENLSASVLTETATGFKAVLHNGYTSSSATIYYNWLAIGRWK